MLACLREEKRRELSRAGHTPAVLAAQLEVHMCPAATNGPWGWRGGVLSCGSWSLLLGTAQAKETALQEATVALAGEEESAQALLKHILGSNAEVGPRASAVWKRTRADRFCFNGWATVPRSPDPRWRRSCRPSWETLRPTARRCLFSRAMESALPDRL